MKRETWNRLERFSGGRMVRKIALALFLLVLSSVPAKAEGPYFLFGIGSLLVSQQDATDGLNISGINSPVYTPLGIANPSLVVGYRFPHSSTGVELSLETYDDRQYRYTYSYAGTSYGSIFLDVPGVETWCFSGGPVFTVDTPGFWFLSHSYNEFGAKLGYISAQATATQIDFSSGQSGNVTYTGDSYMGSAFYRLRGPVRYSCLEFGAELGYQFASINTLVDSNSTGILSGLNGSQAKNLNGNNAYLDDSGPYFKIILGLGDFGEKEISVVPATTDTEKPTAP
jgi:hypothetical protein